MVQVLIRSILSEETISYFVAEFKQITMRIVGYDQAFVYFLWC